MRKFDQQFDQIFEHAVKGASIRIENILEAIAAGFSCVLGGGEVCPSEKPFSILGLSSISFLINHRANGRWSSEFGKI